MTRPLQSDKPGNISLSADQLYNFGFAIYDDYSGDRIHPISLSYKLGFNSDTAEIDAVKRQAIEVKSAVPAKPAPIAVAETSTSGAAAKRDSNRIAVDWNKSGSREITLFYPGQTSMEWMLNGRNHGGSRAFAKSGDSCVGSHDRETASMGEKMVKGEKAEETPIPSKRGSIPVKVNASYDNLYLKFSWEKTDHVAVRFTGGGMLDPGNAMKMALILATDELEYVSQAGCWATSHHANRTMLDALAPDLATTSEAATILDVSNGTTKCVKESRTNIEIKGRGDKPCGGWDKLKPADEIMAAGEGSAIMDLLRYKSGTGAVETGHVFEQRDMQGREECIVNARITAITGWWKISGPQLSEKLGDINPVPGQKYNFGFAIRDDFSNARIHHVSLGYKLGLDDADANLNATHQ